MRPSRAFIQTAKTAIWLAAAAALIFTLSGALILVLSVYWDRPYSELAHGGIGALVPITLTLLSIALQVWRSFSQDSAIQDSSSDSDFEGL